MARPLKPRTPLAARLIQAREQAGFKNRSDFADRIGVAADTLGTYERGVAEPNTNLLMVYNETFGININWLLTGKGDVFDDATKPSRPVLFPELMEGLVEAVLKVHREFGITLPDGKAAAEATELYNRLLQQGSDTASEEGRRLLMPFIEHLLRERLEKAREEPGTGKREVS
ncbi:helix-turn-helix domain-containing protein [Martelella mediterranea]|uniref:Bacteriophage CI repressor-like protein n=1 Tax=Martelella mediterranea TaxID=293089 RepID=A0A4R3NKM1_9HYPH|nr:helix-turn-helix transcriptional regulator [Martelella mediterranea]TCT35412.1 bacteriophage CI repressor-like protein [Martelella mediterranea]